MTRNLKALGLALVAVFAMSALSAASAQAVVQFTGEETPGGHVATTIKGTTKTGSIEKFTAGISAIECHNTYSSSSATGVETDLTVKVTEVRTPDTVVGGHCNAKAAGVNFKADIDFNGCHYVFHAGTRITETMEYTGTVDIVCNTEGKAGPITIKVTKNGGTETKCTLKVPAQNGLSHVLYKVNTEKPTSVTVVANIKKEAGKKGITYSSEGGLLNCGVADGEHVEGSEYTGEATVTGTNGKGEPIDVDVSG